MACTGNHVGVTLLINDELGYIYGRPENATAVQRCGTRVGQVSSLPLTASRLLPAGNT